MNRPTQAHLDAEALVLEAVESLIARLICGQTEPTALIASSAPADMCDRMAMSHMRSGGKRMRARLALQAARAIAAGAGDEARADRLAMLAVPWAAAVELMHNASLIHDDLQDGDRVRRGSPAVWAQFGEHQAINAGDLLLMLPTVALEHLPVDDGVRWRLAACLARHGAATVRGQAAEMALRGEVRMDHQAYLDAARGKTAGLFGMPVEGSALLCGLSAESARALAVPFEELGLLYQIQDDVIDLFGDKGRDEPGADVREGKVSALAVAHVHLHPGERAWLADVLRTPRERTTGDVVREVMVRFARDGALDEALRWIDEIGQRVDQSILRDFPELHAVAMRLRDRFLEPLARLRRPVATDLGPATPVAPISPPLASASVDHDRARTP